MRPPLDADRLRRFMEVLGRTVRGPGRVFLTGGATALLEGWRESTVDVDIKFDPEPLGAFEAIARLKDELDINIELASPDQFIPPLPGWEARSKHIQSVGDVDFLHYDPYAQALSKLERGHARDLADIDAMVARKLIEPDEMERLFKAIAPELVRYPAIDATSYAELVNEFVQRHKKR